MLCPPGTGKTHMAISLGITAARNYRCHPFTWTKTADQLLPHCRPGKGTSFTRH
jgi:DNA replication protein DnaC